MAIIKTNDTRKRIIEKRVEVRPVTCYDYY